MRKILTVILTVFISLLFTGCSNLSSSASSEPADLNVYAAVTLKSALEELKPVFEDSYEGLTLTLTYGNSNDLAAQIQKGTTNQVDEPEHDGEEVEVQRSADFFIASAQKPMNILQEENLIVPKTREDFVTNPLVLIAPADSTLTTIDEIGTETVQQVAIGEPSTIPAGQYAVEALEHLGLYTDVEPKLVYGKSVSQVLQYVGNSDIPAGIVYKTDAVSDPDVKIVAEFPLNSYNIITYPMAEIAGSDYSKQIEKLEEFLLSNTAQQIMQKYGFAPPVTAVSSEENTN